MIAFYDLWPGYRTGLFAKKQINKGVVRKKKLSTEVSKQMIYIALKSTNESGHLSALESTRGQKFGEDWACSFRDMLRDRQAHRTTYRHTYSQYSTPLMGVGKKHKSQTSIALCRNMQNHGTTV